MTTANTNTRASLLAGLRTGGVRSSMDVSHTASPGGTFDLRPPSNYRPTSFSEDTEKFHQNISLDRDVPMAVAVDGPINHFSQHQGTRGMNPNSVPFSPGFAPQAHIQMQMLQLEMMRIQAMQAQQYQEIMAQAALQQHLQTQGRERRTSLAFNPPATAGPTTNSFDLRAATLSAQLRRANQTDQIRSQLGVASDDHVPMTAALGGRFGSRTMSGSLHAPNLARFDEHGDPPPTPNSTTVISGGTFLGHPGSNTPTVQITTPSKSDSASSWRRGGNNNSVLSANRAVSSPSLKVTPPPSDEEYLSPSLNSLKSRPQPLRFSSAVSRLLPTVTIDVTDDETDGETHSSGSSVKSVASHSSPTTPRSSTSNEMPLSPREEASKRLYEGLGIGRPVSSTPSDGAHSHFTISTGPGHRMVSQPTRQPRGPPSGDELGPKNFATRIRRKAIGGLGMLMGARERREVVEAY